MAAQGLSRARPSAIGAAQLGRLVARLGLHQIDSVNVLARAHYLPAFSRLGPYDRGLLDRAAWGPRRGRRLWEYWAHEASLLPLDLHPLLRWRMARAERGEGIYRGLKPFAVERRAEAEALLRRIEADGPATAAALADARGAGGWWGWSDTKRALEWLFWAGRLTTTTRTPAFERVYDLPERVLPADLLALPTPTEEEAQRALVERAARALGVATAGDLLDYFRLGPEARPRIAELVETGRLRPVEVRGWPAPAWLHVDAVVPRRVAGEALLAPFDPLIWRRERAERLFGLRYRIEIYTPAAQRVHGYYVLPFLLDGWFAARVDLKAERGRRALLVQAAHAEEGAPANTAERLRAELGRMAS